MSYLLDTTVLLDYVHGRPSAIALVEELFAQSASLFTCAVVTCESLTGGDDDERAAIRGLLDALEFVALSPIAARHAGDSRYGRGAERGARSLADALIGALAWSMDATVVTRNPTDFERQDVSVRSYP